MPTDFERPHITSFKGGRVEFYIDKELTEKIGELSRKFGATNFMTMLSAWYVLLAKYSGQEEIIVGTPVSGRTRDEIRETVGMFVNMLAIRSFPSLDKKYDEFLNEVKENTFEALKNQDYQFDTLVEHMDIKRLNRNPYLTCRLITTTWRLLIWKWKDLSLFHVKCLLNRYLSICC